MTRLWNQEKPKLMIRLLLGFLTLMSLAYGLIVSLRTILYRWGVFKTRRLNTVVISIGNLTVGGTGKTPLVIAMAEYLSRKGLKVGVLSRGYKGQRQRNHQWVSDGQRVLATPAEVGEEPYLIALRLPKVPVVVGRNRYRSGRALLQHFNLDAILLDDGFQHLQLYRDLNLLVIDGAIPFGPAGSKGYLLPRGMLREPLHGIKRASAVLMSRMEQSDQWSEIVRQVRCHHSQVPVFGLFFKPSGLIDLTSGRTKDTTSLKGQSVLAFSGIGHPASFRFFLEQLGGKIIDEVVFEDHHRYTEREVKALLQAAQAKGVDAVITTEKDGVKVRAFLNPNDCIWALRMDLERIEEPEAWERFIHAYLKVS